MQKQQLCELPPRPPVNPSYGSCRSRKKKRPWNIKTKRENLAICHHLPTRDILTILYLIRCVYTHTITQYNIMLLTLSPRALYTRGDKCATLLHFVPVVVWILLNYRSSGLLFTACTNTSSSSSLSSPSSSSSLYIVDGTHPFLFQSSYLYN